MLDVIEQIGAFAGLAAFLGLAVLSLLYFTQARDLRRLRDWAGSAPERDAERKEATSAAAAQRAEELRRLEEGRTAERRALDEREERRRRREAGLPERSAAGRIGGWFSGLGERMAEPRYLVVLFVALLALVGGGAYALLGGGDNGRAQPSAGDRSPAKSKRAAAQLPASEIEVAVLNGTAVSGLAATYGDMVESEGFALGAVGNTTESYSRSVVMFERGHAPEAKRVAKALDIPKVELMEAAVQRVAEGAKVAVIAGEDNASAAS